MLQAFQEGRIRTMGIARAPAQRSSELLTAYAKNAPEMACYSNTHCPNAVYWPEPANT